MRGTGFALAAAFLAPLPLLAQSPCQPLAYRGDDHRPAFAARGAGGLSEIDVQRRCAAWEFTLEAKAEFIPPNRATVILRTGSELPRPFGGLPPAAAPALLPSAEAPRLGLGLAPGTLQ